MFKNSKNSHAAGKYGNDQWMKKKLPAEFTYDEKDPDEQKYYKGIQRQIHFHEVAKNNPVIVEADPKLISMSH